MCPRIANATSTARWATVHRTGVGEAAKVVTRPRYRPTSPASAAMRRAALEGQRVVMASDITDPVPHADDDEVVAPDLTQGTADIPETVPDAYAQAVDPDTDPTG